MRQVVQFSQLAIDCFFFAKVCSGHCKKYTKADLFLRGTEMSPIRSRYPKRNLASWSIVLTDVSQTEAVVWKPLFMHVTSAQHAFIAEIRHCCFSAYKLEKGSESSLSVSRIWMITRLQHHVPYLWNIILFVAKGLVQAGQLGYFSRLGYSPDRENERFTSVRECIEYSSSTSCGNCGTKSKKWALVSYLKDQ